MHETHDAEIPSAAFETFLAVNRGRTISAAAATLHVSQPAATRRLQLLERRLGTTLFDRTPSGMHLTSAGEALLPHAERALAASSDAVRAVAEHLAGAGGGVRLGIVGSLVDALAGLLRTYVGEHPDVEVSITTASSAQLTDLVRRGEVGFGISYAQPDDSDLEMRTLFTEGLVVVCAADHELAGGRLTAASLRRHRWLVFPDVAGQPESSGSIARRLLERHHVPAARLRPIDSLSAQRALAVAGYGLALLPATMIDAELRNGTLATIEAPALVMDVAVTLTQRRNAYLGPADRAMLDLLVSGPLSWPASPPSARRGRGARSRSKPESHR